MLPSRLRREAVAESQSEGGFNPSEEAAEAMDLLQKPQIITHIEQNLNYTLFDVKWIPSSAKMVVMGSLPRDTGALQVYEISRGELEKVTEVRTN